MMINALLMCSLSKSGNEHMRTNAYAIQPMSRKARPIVFP